MREHKPLAPIQLPNVSQVVYEVLRGQILHGDFIPGQSLNLRALEAQLDVSRTPLKLALERLQLDGLIIVHPRRGTYVTTFEGSDIRECFELRIAIEGEALRHAFKPHNREQLGRLVQLFDVMGGYFADERTWLDQLIEFMDLDREAHLNMVALSGNMRMQQAYERANVQGYIAIMGGRFSYEDTLHTQQEHGAIYEALKQSDLSYLLDAARTHLVQAGERALHRLAAYEGRVG